MAVDNLGNVMITLNDVKKFSEEKLRNLKCYQCNEDNFTVGYKMSDQDSDEITMPSISRFYKPPKFGPAYIQEYLPLVCNNCGVTTLIHAHTIHDWLENQKKKADENG